MTPKKDGGPAFPVINAPGAKEDYPGMSLRDWFAGMALQGITGRNKTYWRNDVEVNSIGEVSKLSYIFADVMLAEREKTKDIEARENGERGDEKL